MSLPPRVGGWAAAAVRHGLGAKASATRAARCALLGVRLEAIEDDAGQPLCVVGKWTYTRQLRAVDEVVAFVARLGGPYA